MFSKNESSQLKKEFWTVFGQYMKPVPFADEERNSWINYKTGEKNIAFKTDADNKTASVSIELNHTEEGLQELYFQQFQEVKHLLHNSLNEEWTWQLHIQRPTTGTISRIYTLKQNISIYKKEDWPFLISFFKPRLIALDEFWSQAKYAFEALR